MAMFLNYAACATAVLILYGRIWVVFIMAFFVFRKVTNYSFYFIGTNSKILFLLGRIAIGQLFVMVVAPYLTNIDYLMRSNDSFTLGIFSQGTEVPDINLKLSDMLENYRILTPKLWV